MNSCPVLEPGYFFGLPLCSRHQPSAIGRFYQIFSLIAVPRHDHTPILEIRKLTLPPQAFENDGFVGWAVSKSHYSQEFRERFARTIEQKKQVVAQAKASR